VILSVNILINFIPMKRVYVAKHRKYLSLIFV